MTPGRQRGVRSLRSGHRGTLDGSGEALCDSRVDKEALDETGIDREASDGSEEDKEPLDDSGINRKASEEVVGGGWDEGR